MSVHNDDDCVFYELMCVIVNYGMADKVVKTAKQKGVLGATVFYGRGIIKNIVLSFLGLDDSRKEIIWMLADKKLVEDIAEALVKKFDFQKPNHGIAFCVPVTNAWGAGINDCELETRKKEGIVINKVIFAIVEKGEAEVVVEAATKAGARGGTIINARGSGIHETGKVFSMDIEPEKEIVMILAKTNITDGIVKAIKEIVKPSKPGNGVVFVQDVGKTYGVYA